MLSALALPEEQSDEEKEETTPINSEERMEVTRLAFAIISEALRDHQVNLNYFNVSLQSKRILE